jgi:hypothetical protein
MFLLASSDDRRPHRGGPPQSSKRAAWIRSRTAVAWTKSTAFSWRPRLPTNKGERGQAPRTPDNYTENFNSVGVRSFVPGGAPIAATQDTTANSANAGQHGCGSLGSVGCGHCRCLVDVWNFVHVNISSSARMAGARGSATRRRSFAAREPVQLQLWVRMFCLQSRRSARRAGPWAIF